MTSIRSGKVYVFFAALFMGTFFWPGLFAKNTENNLKPVALELALKEGEPSEFMSSATTTYERLNLETIGLSYKAFEYAVRGLEKLKEAGKVANDHIISIADFTQPSSTKRLFIIDLENQILLYHTYVAHGQRSGKAYAQTFSNKPESYQSSLGFYVTSGTYIGRNGYSMQLEGMEKGINDKAAQRAIVMHGAPYVHESLIRSQGYIGRSLGCPAVPEKLNRPIIDKIKNGTCMFIYAEQQHYLRRSEILNS